MFPVACTIYAEEKAWKGRRESVRRGRADKRGWDWPDWQEWRERERGTKIIGQILRKRQRVRTSDARRRWHKLN